MCGIKKLLLLELLVLELYCVCWIYIDKGFLKYKKLVIGGVLEKKY